jgi:cytoskeleton protein RodZ
MSAEMHDEATSVPAADGPGARLKAARESAGLSLDQAAQQLKLAPRQVKALEDQDFEHLPGRTFTRGFVRNYARLLNLDAEGLLALMPDASNAPALEAPTLQSTGAMIAELPTREKATPNFTRLLIPLVLIACVVGAASYEWYRGGLMTAGEAVRSRVAKAEPTGDTASPPASLSSTPLPNPLAEAPKVEPAASIPTPIAPPPAPAPAETASAPSTSAAMPSTEAPVASAAEAASSPVPTAADAPLQLSYRGPSWTEVRDRAGQVLVLRLVPAGSEQSVRGTPPFEVVIGNAAAVTLVYRGVAVDLAPFTHGNVARLRLS